MSEALEKAARAIDPVAFEENDRARALGYDHAWRGRMRLAEKHARAAITAFLSEAGKEPTLARVVTDAHLFRMETRRVIEALMLLVSDKEA